MSWPGLLAGGRQKTDGTHDLGAQPKICRSQVDLSDHRTARDVASWGSQSELEFTSAAVQLGPRREASPFFWSGSGSGAAGEVSAVPFVAEQGNVYVAPTSDTGKILVITSHTRASPAFVLSNFGHHSLQGSASSTGSSISIGSAQHWLLHQTGPAHN